jgi:nitrate reductase gamma subunit
MYAYSNHSDTFAHILLLLLTAIGLMPGGSVYKDEVHEHPQYNTVHMSTIQVHEHYKTQETENTEKTENT